jgi:hypothetical protein
MPSLSQAQTAMIRHVYQQIDSIIYKSQFGIVEEVQIDLRHKHFDSNEFEIPEALFKARELCSDGPRLIFPWTEVSESFSSPNNCNNLESSSGSDVDMSEFIIEKGDKLFVNRINLIDPEKLHRGCNIGRRHVYLSIKRKNEDDIDIDQPLLLKPKNEIIEREFSGNYYSAVKGRIKNYFSIDEVVGGIDNIKEDDSFSYRALRKLSGLIRLWGSHGKEVIEEKGCLVVLPTCSLEEEHDKTNIWLTINDAVALGYLWAKSEDQRNQALFEESAAQKSAAGRRSGDSRGRDADKWKQVFQARVEELWTSTTKKPTRKKMIDIILNDMEKWDVARQRLNLPDAAMPGDESLRKEIPKVMRMIERNEGSRG